MAEVKCTSSCSMDDPRADTTQCVLCRTYYHIDCVGVLKKFKNHPFTCEDCKCMPKMIYDILEIVKNTKDELLKQVNSLTADVQRNEMECSRLREENKKLAKSVADLTAKEGREKWENFRKNEDKQDFKELVVSDSMLKFLDDKKLNNTKVVSIQGASIDAVQKELEKPELHGSQLERVVLMVGTNELKPEKENCIDDMRKKFNSLIDAAQSIAKNVTLSSVCPRLDDSQEMVEPANEMLTGICEEKNCILLNHKDTFTLADGSVNDGYLVGGRGPHLTKSGLNRIAKNLKLQIKEGISDVSKTMNTYGNVSQRDGRRPNQPPQRRPLLPDVRYNHRGCVLCNEGGHNASSCRHRHMGPVICRTCQIPGHKAKHHQGSPQ